MLPREHSAILSTFIKLPFVIKIFVLFIFEWPFYTGFTVFDSQLLLQNLKEMFKGNMQIGWQINMNVEALRGSAVDC